MANRSGLTVDDLHRLNRLLAIGLALESDARTAWLAALGEEDLHLQAVLEGLLNRRATEIQSTLSAPTHVARVAAEAMAAMRREQTGDRIGPWRLERRLAEGGMGTVWLAQRADGVLQRTAALKLPRAEWIDHGLAQRIAREREILARLTHPAIAVLYDAGVTAEGRPYLALEYVDGVPIDAWCKGRDLKATLRLFVQVVRAVAYAHAQLVIHRDLKPANVLVTPAGQPKLLDFGISKLMAGDSTSADATALTRLAGRPMTLPYASPEQVLGLPITAAADIYALGIMLFELLTGARPYRAGSPRELEEEILRGDLRKPSAAAEPAQARALRGDLDAVVATALKRQPADRYQSAAELADDLEDYLAGKPVRARPDSRGYRLRKFVDRNKPAVAAVAGVVLALAVGFGVALRQAEEARAQAQRATALSAFVLSLIQQTDPSASAQTRAADIAVLKAIEDRVDREFEGGADELLRLRISIGTAYRNRGEMAAAQRVFQRAVDEAVPRLPADDPMLLRAMVMAADGRLIVSTSAASQLEAAIPALRARRSRDSEVAEILVEALLTRHSLGTFYGVPTYLSVEETLATLDEAGRVALEHFGAGSRLHLRTAALTGRFTELTRGSEAALVVLAPAVEQARQRRDGVDASPEFFAAAAQEAIFACRAGRTHEGLRSLQRLHDSISAAHGEASYLLEPVFAGVGECRFELGDATAFGWIEDAYLVAARRELVPSTNLMARAMRAHQAAIGVRDLDAAERYYQAAIDNARAIPESDVRERLTRTLRARRVCELTIRGEADKALELGQPLVARMSTEHAAIALPWTSSAWMCVAEAHRQLGDYAEVVRIVDAYAERCSAMRAIAPNSSAWCERHALAMKALVQLDQGQLANATETTETLRSLGDFRRDHRPSIALGRLLIATGRADEALEVLRQTYGDWLSIRPTSPEAYEALYWFGRSYQAVGDRRGDRMVAQARQELQTSPISYHRALVDRNGP